MNIFKNILQKLKNLIHKMFKTSLLDESSIVNYIYTAESLPAPLSIESENQLVQAFQNENDLQAKSKLIEHNLRLVVYIAKKFENNKLDMQDIISVGSIGLIKAVDSYKLDKNIKLATYASRCIENEILMYLRKINKTLNDLSLDDSLVNDDEGNRMPLGEMIPDEKLVADEVELEDQKSCIVQMIQNLNEREKTIISLRYGLNVFDELTQKEVADKLNISQSYISRLEKKILHKLKIEMKNSMN